MTLRSALSWGSFGGQPAKGVSIWEGAMLDCVILYRVNGGPVKIVRRVTLSGDETDDISEFRNIDEAVDWADHNPLFNSGQADFQIVELDEL